MGIKRQIRYAFGSKIAKKDFKEVLFFVNALTAPERDARLRELDVKFGFYQPKQQDFLRATYSKAYAKGLNAVANDIFTNTSKATYTELKDRFEDHPQIETPDWDFIQDVASQKPKALNELLGATNQAGYEVKFSYYIYEKYYIDGPSEIEDALDAPDGLTEDSIYFVSDMAYSDGIEHKVELIATKEIQRLAEELLESKY